MSFRLFEKDLDPLLDPRVVLGLLLDPLPVALAAAAVLALFRRFLFVVVVAALVAFAAVADAFCDAQEHQPDTANDGPRDEIEDARRHHDDPKWRPF